MATKTNAASAALTSGSSIITGFNYSKEWCFVKLANGITGIIGEKSDYPMSEMMKLKGIKLTYDFVGKVGDHDRYRIGFSLE
jgi:hypothetical protein